MATIRPITAHDAEGYNRCLAEVALERKYIGFVEPPSIERSIAWVETALRDDYPFFVALENDMVVGWCDIALNSREGFSHVGHLGMAVIAAHRGKGIGAALLQSALQRARELGRERIDLDVYSNNHAAIALYKKLGFVEEGLKHRGRKLDGEYYDIMQMALLFDWVPPTPG